MTGKLTLHDGTCAKQSTEHTLRLAVKLGSCEKLGSIGVRTSFDPIVCLFVGDTVGLDVFVVRPELRRILLDVSLNLEYITLVETLARFSWSITKMALSTAIAIFIE